MSIKCDKCGEKNVNGIKFCGYCGSELRKKDTINNNIINKIKNKFFVKANNMHINYKIIRNIILILIIIISIAALGINVFSDKNEGKQGTSFSHVNICDKGVVIFNYALKENNINPELIESISIDAINEKTNGTKYVIKFKDNSNLDEKQIYELMSLIEKIYSLQGSHGYKYNDLQYFNRANSDLYERMELIQNNHVYEFYRHVVPSMTTDDIVKLKFKKDNIQIEKADLYPETDTEKSNKILKDMIELDVYHKIDTQQKTETKEVTPESQVSANTYIRSHTAGITKIPIKISNNSQYDIKYIKLNLYEKKNGEIIKSEWANDSSKIKAGATQSLDTYFDFQGSESTIDIEIEEIVFDK